MLFLSLSFIKLYQELLIIHKKAALHLIVFWVINSSSSDWKVLQFKKNAEP